MKILNHKIIAAGVSILLFSSCANITGKVENQLDRLTDRAIQLDSVINTEMDRVIKLDSVINLEDERIKKLDSLYKNTTSKLDSIFKGLKR